MAPVLCAEGEWASGGRRKCGQPPAGTPAGVIDKLVKDIGRVLAGQSLRDWVTKHGGEPMNMTQPEFARFVLSESESAAQIIKAAGIKP